MRIEESLNVKFDKSPPPKSPPLEDDDVLECEIIENQEKDLEIKENEPLNKEIINIKESKDHPLETVIDENGVVSRNKARVFAQGYNQQEGIDFDKTYASVARLESIRILLAYACAHDFKLYQMDVKSAFPKSFINQQVYVAKPPRFINFEKPNHVFKLKKALYGLKQAPKAWYDRLKAFLIDHKSSKTSHLEAVKGIFRYIKGTSHLGLRYPKGTGIETIIYADSDHAGDYVDRKSTKDGEPIDDTKYRSMIGSLLYLTASQPDIMFSVCLCTRFQETLKTSHLEAVKRIFRYIKGTSHLGLWYPKGTGIETIIYVDSDHAGDYVDRKSTSGICTFMRCCLTSWFSKKQTALAISTTEANYISAEKACQQALWMKQTLVDYDINLDDIPVLCDNKGAIDLSKNPVLHSRTKHIEIRHHFLRDNVQKGNISIEKVSSEDNIADILTKPLKREPFNLLRLGLGLMEPNA
ncbi:retrovirus-related pol polyprotein from transposon TNT 1-94 [Tanacetum coccineum]